MLTAIIYIIVILSTLWVVFDSYRNRIPCGNAEFSGGHPFIWLIACVALWIVTFPVYLFRRAKTLKARDAGAVGPAALVVGGLVYAVCLVCVIVSTAMAFGILTVNGGRLTDAQLSKQVADAIERKWREQPQSAKIHMKETALHHTTGNDYEGTVTADVAGATKQFPVHVTYDGKEFRFNVGEEGRLSDAELSSQVAAAIEKNWRGNPDSADVHMKETSLHHKEGDEYEGVVTAEVSGKIRQYAAHVTYDGKKFAYKVGDEISPAAAPAKAAAENSNAAGQPAPAKPAAPGQWPTDKLAYQDSQPAPSPQGFQSPQDAENPTNAGNPTDKLKGLVAKNVTGTWSLDRATKSYRLKDVTLQPREGDHYTGTAVADDAGRERRFPLEVTYDAAHNNLSLQMGDELAERKSDEALRVEIRDAIEKKWRETPQSANVHMKDITLAREGGDDYAGVVTALVSGSERRYQLHVNYDGNHWSYEVGDEIKGLTTDQLRADVGKMIDQKWRENPKSKNVHFKSMTLEEKGGGEYLGSITAEVSGVEKQIPVHVHYDGKSWTYEVE